MHFVKYLIKSIIVFFFVLLVIILVQGGTTFLGMVTIESPTSNLQLFLERSSMVVVAIILLFWTKKNKRELYDRIQKAIDFNRKNRLLLGKAILLALSSLYCAFIISGFLDQYELLHWGVNRYPYYTIIKRFVIVGILGNIIVAIGEEIIFRGFLMNYVLNLSKSKLFALIFTSLVFSLHPYQDFLNYFIAFTSGFIMGYAYLKFKTLYIPIGIHFAYNLFNFTIASDPGRGPQLPYIVKLDYLTIMNGFGAWVDLFIIIGFMMILLFLWQRTNTRVSARKEM